MCLEQTQQPIRIKSQWTKFCNFKMHFIVSFGVFGKALLQCSECREQNIIAICKAKGGAGMTKTWAGSWDKCRVLRERHSVWLQEKLERSGSDEDLEKIRDGMAHTHHERDTSEVLRKSFESSLCCQQTAGILQEGIVQLEFGQPDFPFHPLLCSA